MRALSTAMLCGALLLSLTLLSGCSSTSERGVRRDLSPELRGVAATNSQLKNQRARAWDLNRRQIVDDWQSIWLNDRPMRLSRYPIP